MAKKVVAVVVTYNRKRLLIECLHAILGQSYRVDTIVLIDNASTDGTKEALAQESLLQNTVIEYHAMSSNTGGAGGFHEGLRVAREIDCDWVWVMDDDTVPTPDCLEKLIAADGFIAKQPFHPSVPSASRPSFYASAIYGAEGEFMNLPCINLKQSSNGYAYWYQYLRQGMVSIETATFVSLLIAKKAILQCGLPIKDYFIWGDDTEYTKRLTTYYGDAYFVGDSVAVHKRIGAKAMDIQQETNEERLNLYVYAYRNNKINDLVYHKRSMLKEWLVLLRFTVLRGLKCKNRGDWKRYTIQRKGRWLALLQYKQVKAYIDGQVNANER